MNSISFTLGLVICCLLFSSCRQNSNKEKREVNNEIQNISSLYNYPDKFFFKGSFEDWIKLRNAGLLNEIYPLEIIECNKKDTINDVFIDINFGNYYLISTKFPTRVFVPLFFTDSIGKSFDKYKMLSEEIYNYYKRRYEEQLDFYKRNIHKNEYTLEINFDLIDEITKTYQVIHKEIYQPNFETDPIVTGRRIFTISLKEGTIEYKLEGEFEKEWY